MAGTPRRARKRRTRRAKGASATPADAIASVPSRVVPPGGTAAGGGEIRHVRRSTYLLCGIFLLVPSGTAYIGMTAGGFWSLLIIFPVFLIAFVPAVPLIGMKSTLTISRGAVLRKRWQSWGLTIRRVEIPWPEKQPLPWSIQVVSVKGITSYNLLLKNPIGPDLRFDRYFSMEKAESAKREISNQWKRLLHNGSAPAKRA